MEDRELSSYELKMLTLQFMGQHLGEMKELDKNIVSGLRPVAGSLNPEAIINAIGPSTPPLPSPVLQPQQPPITYAAPVQQAVQQPSPIGVAPVVLTAAPQAEVDPNQLEFNFNSNPYTVRVFEKIESLETKLNRVVETQVRIIEMLEDFKKKEKKTVPSVKNP
jgi:hypothetical protein